MTTTAAAAAAVAIPLSEYIYPTADEARLRDQFLGKRIQNLPTPAAVLDEDVLSRNCERMLRATKTLGVQFRPHVKTHKVGAGLLVAHFLGNCNCRVKDKYSKGGWASGSWTTLKWKGASWFFFFY